MKSKMKKNTRARLVLFFLSAYEIKSRVVRWLFMSYGGDFFPLLSSLH